MGLKEENEYKRHPDLPKFRMDGKASILNGDFIKQTRGRVLAEHSQIMKEFEIAVKEVMRK